MLRLLLGHPDVEIGALTGGSNAGESARGAPAAPGAARRPRPRADHAARPSPVTTSCSWPAARRSPAAIAAALGRRTPSSSTAAPTSGSPTPTLGSAFYGGDHAGTWPYGLPELPGPARAAARRDPDRRARLLPDRLDAGARPGRRGRAGRARRRRGGRLRHQRRRQGRQAAPARQRGHGQRQRRTASAASTGTPPRSCRTSRALAGGAVRVSFTPMLVPMSRGILATCSAPLRDGVTADDARAAYAKAYADEPFVHLLPAGQWPQTQSVLGSNAVHLQVTVDRRGRPAGRRRRRRQPRQGHRPAPPCSASTSRSGSTRPPASTHRGAGAVSVTAPPRASGPPASPPGSSRPAPRTSRSSSTTARATTPPASSPPTAARPTRCCGASRSSQDGVVRAVVLNSGGANCYTGPEGFQTTHAVAERVAEPPRHRRRSTSWSAPPG